MIADAFRCIEIANEEQLKYRESIASLTLLELHAMIRFVDCPSLRLSYRGYLADLRAELVRRSAS